MLTTTSSSPFSAAVCAEISGRKYNIEILFDSKPIDLVAMVEQIEQVFSGAFDHLKKSDGGINIDYLVFFDELNKTWKPLETPYQLFENIQLYAFQRGKTSESLQELPKVDKLFRAPKLPEAVTFRNVHNPGFSKVEKKKIETLFQTIDFQERDAFSLEDMILSFLISGVDLKREAIEKLFHKVDINDDDEVTFDEFCLFAELFPNITETLYWRLCTPPEERHQYQTTAKQLTSLSRKEYEMRKELEQIEEARKVLEGRVYSERLAYRDQNPQRRGMELAEQDLVNKEFALQFHRDMVVQAENIFTETACKFDKSAVAIGSPRRTRLL